MPGYARYAVICSEYAWMMLDLLLLPLAFLQSILPISWKHPRNGPAVKVSTACCQACSKPVTK